MSDERANDGNGSSRMIPRSPRAAIEPAPAPPPPHRRKSRGPIFVLINSLFSLTFILALAATAVFLWGRMQAASPGPLAEDKALVVPRGYNVQEIGALLKREGVIEHSWLFNAGAFVAKARDRLKAGEYVFPKQVSLTRVLEILVEGKSILHQVTIPEGLTSAQVVARLEADDILVGSLRAVPAEGTLLPETYKFTRGTTRQEMVERMRQAHRRVLEDVWRRRSDGLPIKTPEELVTLASIVEKETGRADERTRVAGVFVNRLKRSMRLQSDPTIIYGLAAGKGSLDRSITQSDLEKETPYNTYAIDGLPPTPIANPGRGALEATANPSRTGELYFVADGTGGHVFAATLDEHNRNVARWRGIERRLREQEAAAAPQPPAPAASVTPDLQAPAAGGTTSIPKARVVPIKPKT